MSRLVYGFRSVNELLSRSRSVELLWVVPTLGGRRDPNGGLVQRARSKGVRVQEASREQLDAICSTKSHQGVVAIAGDYRYLDLEDLVSPAGAPSLLLAVDGVTDPQNLGAMFRAALVLGATGVVLTKDRCAAVSDVVVRVSSGSTEHLSCARVTNLARALRQLKEMGLWVVATVERGGSCPSDVSFMEPTVVVMGNEERGVRPGVLKTADHLVTIPARGPIPALNVATATAVLFYEASRQRGNLG